MGLNFTKRLLPASNLALRTVLPKDCFVAEFSFFVQFYLPWVTQLDNAGLAAKQAVHINTINNALSSQQQIKDLSRIPLQCIQTMEPERGWGGIFMFPVFLSSLTSTQCHCSLECGKKLQSLISHWDTLFTNHLYLPFSSSVECSSLNCLRSLSLAFSCPSCGVPDRKSLGSPFKHSWGNSGSTAILKSNTKHDNVC